MYEVSKEFKKHTDKLFIASKISYFSTCRKLKIRGVNVGESIGYLLH